MVCMKDANFSAKTHYLPPELCWCKLETECCTLPLQPAELKRPSAAWFCLRFLPVIKGLSFPLSAKWLLSRGSSECWGFLCITIKSALEVTCCDLMLYRENGIELIWILHIFTASWRIVWELASSMQTSGDELFQRCLRAESKMGGAVMVT